jgi:hypothetical protein
MQFLKEHLIGDYQWTDEPQNALFTGLPTRRIFDISNGNQVLFIINAVALSARSFSIEDGREMENMIQNRLPLATQSEISVYNSLKAALIKS